MSYKEISIAIDGPAGSGKSTIAKEVALKFGYIYIDTGAMYRAITLKALRNNILLTDGNQLTNLAENTVVSLEYESVNHGSRLHVIMDNLDVSEEIRIGTVVLPKAELKIFLTASVTERSKRRWLELQENGIAVDLQNLEEQIRQRDFFDSHREIDPLCQAKEAILLDTTNLNIEQVITKVIELAITKGARLS